MVLDKQNIIDECRSLTQFDDVLISDVEMETLYQIAVEDIEGIIGRDLEEVENRAAGRAVFWSLCLFTKIHVGELDGIDFSLGSMRINQMPRRDITRVWYKKSDRYIGMLQSASSIGIRNINRTDREYGN